MWRRRASGDNEESGIWNLVRNETDTLLISMYAKMFPLMETAERAHVYVPFGVVKYERVHSLRTRVMIIRFCRASEIT